MSCKPVDRHLQWRILVSFVLLVQCSGLSIDGIQLLSLKYTVLSDPLAALDSWNYDDETPCSWKGVTCAPLGSAYEYSRVVGLSLSDCQILGSIPPDLGMIQHLRTLDLSNNFFNGSIPLSIFNASELRLLDFSNNLIAGELPEVVGRLRDLQFLNLSDNALAGKVPSNLTSLRNLTVVSLRNNYLSGSLPSGLDFVQVLDLSSNLINGTLPPDFGGRSLRSLNVSYNKLSGEIPPEFAENFSENATLDLSFNNLIGEVPEIGVLMNQDATSFRGNQDLCGKLLKKQCTIPSTLSSPPNGTQTTSPPAIAAIPKTIDSTPEESNGTTSNPTQKQGQKGLRSGTIVGIVIGDIVGIGILAIVFLYVYQLKKKKTVPTRKEADESREYWSTSSSESKGITAWSCLRKKGGEDEESSETTASDSEEGKREGANGDHYQQRQLQQEKQKNGSLVTVDGETELELETLLKASAYILGATGSSIMYKAVLEDGTTLAVRRIGESGLERFRDFENQVRAIAKLIHPNLVRIRGFYWGVDEKLIIYDFVSNGSLANARYRKAGSSPCHLPWEVRLKVARGVARGLSYLHEKKHVHGNLKPSNILLGADMEPRIGDFGLERLVSGDNSYKAGGSARNFGSKRSTTSRDSLPDLAAIGPSPSPSPSSMGCVFPYHAPESLRSLKPNPKWDVYSFGVILLELVTGKVITSDEFGISGLPAEDKSRLLRMADVAIRADLEGKEEDLLACLKLGYSCLSPIPQKRPPMKEALQVLEKISASSSFSPYYYGH